jgi:uncharacterized tellurite resistance protein B-like protein
MINRIKQLFTAGGGAESGRPEDELRLAAAALLVEAASMDGDFDDQERHTIAGLLHRRFDLNEDETATLIAEAEDAVDASGQLYAFTRIVKDRYDAEERIGMIEMLWEVAFADGNVDHFESNLIRRIGGLIYVSDRDRGEAKKRVMAKLGRPAPPV